VTIVATGMRIDEYERTRASDLKPNIHGVRIPGRKTEASDNVMFVDPSVWPYPVRPRVPWHDATLAPPPMTSSRLTDARCPPRGGRGQDPAHGLAGYGRQMVAKIMYFWLYNWPESYYLGCQSAQDLINSWTQLARKIVAGLSPAAVRDSPWWKGAAEIDGDPDLAR